MSAASRAPRHPCLCGDPSPASAHQPGLITKICYFTINHEKLISDYPYEISPSPGKAPHVQLFHIPYWEISGRGPPPADLTGSNVGDIYIDVSPRQYAAYGKVADGSWKRWCDPQPLNKTEDIIVKHPHFRHRLLWCSDAKGVSWFVSTTVSSNQERAKEKGLVSLDAEKTEEARWREASAIIGEWLGESERSHTATARRSTSPLSPPLESRESSPVPVPVLGKRKTRSQDVSAPCLDGKRYKTLLQCSIQRLKDEKDELAEEICVLEKHLDSRPGPVQDQHLNVAEPKQFSEWMEKVIVDGIKTSRNGPYLSKL
ncbi:hypothetical protein B0H19DRAFT_1170389 [Mycena capillaripes]|nr:hypothetical protein B0H19DRAFT_1170389 [Mycena capillaripes]